MRHGAARRRLASLGDGVLAPGVEAAVRDHAAACGRCRRVLRELRAAEALLARLPATCLPLAVNAEAEARLAGLARWAPSPQAPAPLWRLPALGALAAAAALALAISVQPGEAPPALHSAAGSHVAAAQRVPVSFLVPISVGSGVNYSWRL